MTIIDLPEGVEHGTPEGHEAGCKGEKHCPALHTHGMTCTYAYVRSTTTPDRYFKAKARDPRPAAIARTLGFKPISRGALEVLQEDEKLKARSAAMQERHVAKAAALEPAATPVDEPTTEVLVERPDPQVGSLDEAAAQPLAERSNDPRESDETPAVDEAAAVQAQGEGVAEGEGMGHPTPASAEKPATTADDEKRRRAEIRAWAAEHGHTVSKAGRIPHAIVVAWLQDDPTLLPGKADNNTSLATTEAQPEKGFEVFKKPKRTPKSAPSTPPADTATITTDRFTAGLTTRAKSTKLREIREWARTNGFPGVPTRGKIPNDALAAYAGAHRGEGAGAPAPADPVEQVAARLERVLEETPEQTELTATAAMISAEALVEHGLVEGTVEEVAAGLLQSQRSELLDETRARIEEPPRPEWGEVAAASDVEHAREIAARLFLELTDAEAARDRAETALALTLQKWDDMSARALVLELRLSVARMQASYLRDAYRVEEAGALDLADRLAIASDQVAALVARLDRAEAERDHLKSLIVSATTRRRRRRLRRATS